MAKIEINGEQLLLTPGQRIPLKMRNPVMYDDILPKYYSMPFTIDLSEGNNSQLLGYPQYWKNKLKMTQSIDCLVYLFGQNIPRKSILTIRSASDRYAEVNITVDKNVDDVGDKKLNEVEMGSYQFADTSVCQIKMGLYAKVFPTDSIYDVFFSVNGTQYTFQVELLGGNTVTGFKNGCNVFIPAFVSNLNSVQSLFTASYQFNDNSAEAELTLTSNTAGASGVLYLTDIIQTQTGGSYGHWYWHILDETSWIQSHLIDIRDGIKDIINNYNPDIHPVVFPVVENITFIDDDNYQGFQNAYFIEATYNKDNIAFLTPMPHLVYVMKKVFTALGFEATGSFFNDENIKRFILYSNVAIDAWYHLWGDTVTNWNNYLEPFQYSVDRDVNIHANAIDIKKHTPDMTVKEFLTAVRGLFNLKYDYDYNSMTVIVSLMQQNYESSMQKAKDYTDRIVNLWQLQNPTTKSEVIKLFKFEEDSADGKPKQLGVLNYQKPLVVNPNGQKEITPKVSSICEEKVQGNNVAVVQMEGVYKDGGTPTKLKLLQYYNKLTTVDAGTPGWMQIWNNASPYQSAAFAFNLDAYAGFTYTSQWSIRWDTEKGIYAKCWQGFAQLLNDGLQLKIKMTFDNADLYALDKEIFQLLDGSLAIWKDVEADINTENDAICDCVYQIL